jgi:hypothetical protein
VPAGGAKLGAGRETPGLVGTLGLVPWGGRPLTTFPLEPGLMTGGGEIIAGGGGVIGLVGFGVGVEPGIWKAEVPATGPPLAAVLPGPFVKMPISGFGGAARVCRDVLPS